MSEPRALVEHFFRHEFGRLVAVLTRSLGVRRLDLAEDVVQAAHKQALQTWSRRGVPEDPAGWLYRTARNLAIDALRRERTHAQVLSRVAENAERESSPLAAHFADEIGDEPLRLLFLCCHEAVPTESRVAIALRTLCGFSTAEIARALLTTDANVQKRIERARDRLRELDVDFDTPDAAQLRARLDAVLAVVYLLFNRGCHVTHSGTCRSTATCAMRPTAGTDARLPIPSATSRPVHALLAASLFHGAHADARIALDGAIVLLEEQDRSAWNWADVVKAWRGSPGRPSATKPRGTSTWKPASPGSTAARLTFADTDWRRLAGCTRHARCASRHVAAELAQPRGRRSACTARKPASTAWPPSSRKTFPPVIPAGTRPSASSISASANTPPPSAPGGKRPLPRLRRPRILLRRLAVCRPDGGEPATE